ncbi:MAG: hypothetical protein AB6733_17970 [Clostridiaceae bacterium]
MKRFAKKFFKFLITIILISICLIGCSNEKNITLTDDVKDAEKNNVINNLERVKQLNIDGKEGYNPVYWKDESNIIAIKPKVNEDSLEVYNINIDNSQLTKIDEIKGILISGFYRSNDRKRVLLVNDKKLMLYDVEKNTTKQIYDLDKASKQIETEYKVEKDWDFLAKSNIQIVTGSDKFVSIIARKQYDGYHYDYIKIINLETNKVTELQPKEDLALERVFYSKLSNKFYVSSPSERIYSFSLENPDDFKEVIKIPDLNHSSWTVDDKGEFVYFITKIEKNEIMKYDVKNNSVSKVEGINFIENSQSDERIEDIGLRGNLLVFKSRSLKNKVSNLYIGTLSDNKINTFGKLNMEKTNEEDNEFVSLMNEKGDKMINSISYYNSEEDGRHEYTIEKIK